METGKVLVLGANGMLGSQLMRVYGAGAVGWTRGDKNNFDFEQIADFRPLIKSLNPSAIINCVAYNDVNRAESEEKKAFRVNAESVGELCKIGRELGIPVVHFSTNYVFDGEKGEYVEDDKANPLSVYGKSKYAGEQHVQKNTDKFYIIRTSVLFGERSQDSESKKSFVEFVLDQAEKKEPIYAYTDEIGSFTYAVDLARAVKLLLEQSKPYGIYHIVNSGFASRFELAHETLKIRDLLGEADLQPVTLDERPRVAQIPKSAVLLNTKLPPPRSWQQALREFLTSSKL